MGIDMSARDRLVWRKVIEMKTKAMTTEQINKEFIPFLLKNQHLLPKDHPVFPILRRWDPLTQSLRPVEDEDD